MAEPLLAVEVHVLSDVERLATHGGPRRIVFYGAESLSKARAMLSLLRSKGLLRKPKARAYSYLNFPDVDDIEDERSDSEQEGSNSNSIVPPQIERSEEEGYNSNGIGIGPAHDDVGRWGGWVSEQQENPDLGLALERALFDADADADAEADADDHHEGGTDHYRDIFTHGWEAENYHTFCRAIDLAQILEEVAADVVPLLVSNPADAAALRRLRTHAKAIRGVGKELPGLMGQAPVTVGNYINNVASEALHRIRNGDVAWMASRCDKVLARVMGLYEDQVVSLRLFPVPAA